MKRFGRPAPVLLTIIVTACGPTVAQQEVSSTMSHVHAVVDTVNQCAIQAAHKLEYARIEAKTPLAFDAPFSLEQRTDTSRSTSEEAREIFQWNKDMQVCRQPLLAETADQLPDVHAAILRSQSTHDDIFVDLVKGAITWGDANERLQKFTLDSRQQVSAGFQPYLQVMDAKNQEEITRRQVIGAILLSVATGAAGAAVHASYPQTVTTIHYRVNVAR